MSSLYTLCKTSDLQPGEGRQVEVNGATVAVFNVNGTFHAIRGECTHQGGPLGEGELEGTTVTCPWHGAEFDVTTGAVLGPPASMPEESYTVVIEGDEVKIELP